MNTPDATRLAEGLAEHTGAFADAVDGLPPDTGVPTCPQWRIADLVAHVGQLHRWGAQIVRDAGPVATPDSRDADPGPPADWPGWLRTGTDDLLGAVARTGPQTAVSSFLGPRPAAFWLRRVLHDTCVHHADAALTAGRAFEIAPDLAADTISEALELLSVPGMRAVRPALVELSGHGETLHLRPEEPSMPGWLITRTPDGPTWDRTGARARADVLVTGTVTELLLVFARRRAVADHTVTVTGDRTLLDHWLSHTAM